MSIFKAIAKGIGTTFRKPRLLVILYVVNLVFAVAGRRAVPPSRPEQSSAIRSSARTSGRWTSRGWARPCSSIGNALPAASRASCLVAGVLYLALQIFLNGGIVGRLLDREGRTTLEPFFADCGRYFWRFVRLFLDLRSSSWS